MAKARNWIAMFVLIAVVGGCQCGPKFLENSKIEITELSGPASLEKAATTVQAAAFLDDGHALASLIQDTDGDGIFTGADRASIWKVELRRKSWEELTDSAATSCFLPDSGFAIGTRPVVNNRILYHRVAEDTDSDGLLTTVDNVELWSMKTDGSDPRPVITEGSPRLADVSEQSGRIIYSVRNMSLGKDFYLATAEGASPTRIPIPNMVSACFEPEGEMFTAVVENAAGMSLELVNPQDNYSHKNMLVGNSLLYFAPRWSEDGTTLLAHVCRDADADGRIYINDPGEILTINVQTGDVEQLTLTPAADNRLGGVWGEFGRVLFMGADPTSDEHFRGIRLMAVPVGGGEAKDLYCCFNSALKVFLAPSLNKKRFLVDLWNDTNADGRVDGADRSTLGLIEVR